MKDTKEKAKPISLYKEDGELKSKEEFLSDVEAIYDEATVEEQVEEPCAREMSYSIIEAFTDPENQCDERLTLDTFNFLTRTIYLTEEITTLNSTEIIQKILFYNKIDSIEGIDPEFRSPIKLYINTPGGDIQEVFNIISTIKASKTPVYTITYGCGYSGGFFIGICGHKRFGFMNSSYLFHEGMAIDGGDAHKFLQHVDYYKFQLKRIKNIVIENTKITSEEYDVRHKDDWFLTPSEALHYGVIDEILEDLGGLNG